MLSPVLDKFVAICIAPSAQHKYQYQWQKVSDIFSSIAWYYGDDDFIIQTFNSVAHSDAAHVTCST